MANLSNCSGRYFAGGVRNRCMRGTICRGLPEESYAVVRNGSFGVEAMQIVGKSKGAHKRSVDSASVNLDAVVEE